MEVVELAVDPRRDNVAPGSAVERFAHPQAGRDHARGAIGSDGYFGAHVIEEAAEGLIPKNRIAADFVRFVEIGAIEMAAIADADGFSIHWVRWTARVREPL